MTVARRRKKGGGGKAERRPRGGARESAVARSSADELVHRLEEQGVKDVKIGGFDVDGVLRGKYVSLDKLSSALKKGFGFCDVIFGWDIADAVYDNGVSTGPQTGYPDAQAVLDPRTLRSIPWEPGIASMLCEFRDAAGRDHPACPRSLLRRVIERANKMGFTPKIGAEYEFFLFQETRDSLVEKGFRNLTPLDPGMFGYSWVRTGQDAELMRSILDSMRDFDIRIEALHTETGPGVYEAAIQYDDAMSAADQAALFKVAMKQLAHRHGLAVSFMAKWNAALPGCSGHLHQSLWQGDKNVFYDARAQHGMSRLMRSYIAGQLELARELTALYSPTINSYKRYVPGVWAPLVAAWGIENRTCTVRVIGTGDEKAIRIEYRQTAADMNPYIAMATSLAAGLHGIEKGLELPPETKGDPGDSGPNALPRTLTQATDLLAKSRTARQILGAPFVEHYVASRRWEVKAFERAVTDWELSRYFETV
ncbi:MAG TPA: glutamine synthetase family protein [Polyangiaceae bacterium]|jgi:glutamine synthetase|nr:glutamine synthetase family protein [Polyangiaceae bacterium]